LLFYLYISILGLSFFVSLLSFKLRYPVHLKIFSILLGLTFINEIIAGYFLGALHLKSNHPVYNIFMLIEFWVFAFYYSFIIKNRILKIIILVFLILFPVFWFITCFYFFNGIGHWNSYLIIAGFSFTVFWSAAYCYQLFTSAALIKFRAQSEFWIAVGLIIFYSCNLPYLGMYNFLYRNYDGLAEQLKEVLQPTDCLMYALFIYAYLCRTTNTMKYSQSSSQV
jgi:hypothetical protein